MNTLHAGKIAESNWRVDMDTRDNKRAMELIESLGEAQGVFGDPTEDKLFVVSYPNEQVEPLSKFSRKDLEAAIQLEQLARATTKKINGQACDVYMKTVRATNRS